LGGLALASKVAKAGGLVFNDGSTQAAGSLEGTSIKSTSETGGTKFLREDGDGSCSWQAADIIKGGDIASASPLVIDTDGSYFNVTGTAGFAAMTVAADRQFTLQFDGALTMTHHATNLDLPSEANITTAAGDVATFQSTGANTVQCISYVKADGTAVVGAAAGGSVTNLIINPDFSIRSRGITFTTGTVFTNDDDVYLLDQWLLLSDGNDIVDVTREVDAFAGFKYSIKLDVETASKKFGICQILENVHAENIIGGTCSLSFTAKVNDISAGRLDNIKAVVLSWDSTSDTVTSDVVSAWGAEDTTPTWATNWTAENTPANLSVTTTAARYTIENISIDTVSAKNIAVFIWADGLTGTVTDTLEITGVQLETGASANTVVPSDFSKEYIRCARYSWKWECETPSINVAFAAGRTSGTTGVQFGVTAPVPMRPVVPTATHLGAGVPGAYVHATTSSASSVSISSVSYEPDGNFICLKSNNHSGLTTYQICNIGWDTNGILFTAEL
jgi:hypothetical protein